MVKNRGCAWHSIRIKRVLLTQQRDDNSLNSAIGTTHCCLKAYGTKGDLSTIATTQVVSTVVSTRTLVVRAATWNTFALIAVGAFSVGKIVYIADSWLTIDAT